MNVLRVALSMLFSADRLNVGKREAGVTTWEASKTRLRPKFSSTIDSTVRLIVHPLQPVEDFLNSLGFITGIAISFLHRVDS
jgi:hypothetical protein